jgi:predicted TIM-barrel fold metal-dependent hydrolase
MSDASVTLVPNSSGTTRPRLRAPQDACDCHIHIYDARFPMALPDLRAVANASVADYRLLQRRNGTRRVVVVQPAAYGTDNGVTIDAVAQIGTENARGIAVVHPGVTDTQLLALGRGGICGLRFTQHDPRTAVTRPEMIEPLAHRVHRLGWHVQLHLRAEQIVAMAGLIESLPATIVFDHMGRMPPPEGPRHPAFAIVMRLIDRGRAWVKLSGPYLDTLEGGPRYADVMDLARAFVERAPERCVWGSDWPHPTEPTAKPDDAVLFDLLHEWAPDEPTRHRILVSNPAALYGFPEQNGA